MPKINFSLLTDQMVAGRQRYRCANKPGQRLYGLIGYQCPLWQITGDNCGSFDQSGYEINHIADFSLVHGYVVEDLIALCACCHAVKKNTIKDRKSCICYNSDDSDSDCDDDSDYDDCDDCDDETDSDRSDCDNNDKIDSDIDDLNMVVVSKKSKKNGTNI